MRPARKSISFNLVEARLRKPCLLAEEKFSIRTSGREQEASRSKSFLVWGHVFIILDDGTMLAYLLNTDIWRQPVFEILACPKVGAVWHPGERERTPKKRKVRSTIRFADFLEPPRKF